jgi:hypothetical protein
LHCTVSTIKVIELAKLCFLIGPNIWIFVESSKAVLIRSYSPSLHAACLSITTHVENKVNQSELLDRLMSLSLFANFDCLTTWLIWFCETKNYFFFCRIKSSQILWNKECLVFFGIKSSQTQTKVKQIHEVVFEQDLQKMKYFLSLWFFPSATDLTVFTYLDWCLNVWQELAKRIAPKYWKTMFLARFAILVCTYEHVTWPPNKTMFLQWHFFTLQTFQLFVKVLSCTSNCKQNFQ